MSDEKIPEKYANRAEDFQKFLAEVREKQNAEREEIRSEIQQELAEIRRIEMEKIRKIQEELKNEYSPSEGGTVDDEAMKNGQPN
ncbi:hypothetical protein CAEBREN_14287 [Caenorhabditis brenneri]|uniref:Uncharacterized protein n=1 Tax=Caenorhabditis brenneri TaxID=135651 RepID=G0NSD5_CAEBE|nr:hypothetical protein CAEBREN_14287 [Caenorhabditis brenneri]